MKKSKYLLWGLAIIYVLTRIFHLTLLPLFTDESIYIYWAKYIAENHSHWFISLTDGKPPLLIWMISFLLKLLPANMYLFAGRLPSVFLGLFGLWGIYKLTFLFSRSKLASFVASLLYLLSSFILFYDRMALFDAPLSVMLIWSVYFAVKTSIGQRRRDAILWGICLGLALLFKATAVIFVILTPLIYLIFSGKKYWQRDRLKLLILPIVAIVISEVMNNLQRLSRVYYLTEAKNQQFQQPLNKLFLDPFALTWGNLHGFFAWIIPYYTWPIFILGLVSIVWLIVKKTKLGLTLFTLWFIPIFILATVGREIFPRYILFSTPYFLIAISILLTALALGHKSRWLGAIVLIIFMLPLLRFDYLLLTDPPNAPLPTAERNQYITEHPSGYGLDKVYTFLDELLKTNKVTLVTQGTFGLYPYAFYLQYWDNKNLIVIPRWPLSAIDQDILDAQKTSRVIVLLKEHDKIPDNLPLRLILKAEKPGGKYPILLTTLK